MSKWAVARRNEMLDAIRDNYNNGYLRIYNGTRPADADTALSGNTLLAELRWNATAFGAASAGAITANALTADSSADATGTATFARSFESNGTTVIADHSVSAVGGGGEIQLSSTSITVGGTVSISSAVFTQPVGT